MDTTNINISICDEIASPPPPHMQQALIFLMILLYDKNKSLFKSNFQGQLPKR